MTRSRQLDARSRPIGVFDSGLGGLTVVRHLMCAMPGEDIVYLGDTARVPYGTKSLETVRRFSLEDAFFLLRHSPKMIVMACNTASAAAVDVLKEKCPVPVVDVIRPGASAAVTMTDGPVGVIATEATISSGAYQRAIAALDGRREVLAASCPLLVPIVEEGWAEDDPIVLHVLTHYLKNLQRRRPGAMILGCTHYPLLAGAIGKLMGPDVLLVDSGHATALDVQRRLTELDLLSDQKTGGTLVCFTTDNADRFAHLAERFGRKKPDAVPKVAKPDVVQQVATEELMAAYPGPDAAASMPAGTASVIVNPSPTA